MGVEQADTYLNALIQRFEWLADNPTLGKPRDDPQYYIGQGYFCFPEGVYIIFYVLNKQGLKNSQVEIIGIPRQQMDITEYLA